MRFKNIYKFIELVNMFFMNEYIQLLKLTIIIKSEPNTLRENNGHFKSKFI